jgi:CDP-glycerol glycerophosphotransferase
MLNPINYSKARFFHARKHWKRASEEYGKAVGNHVSAPAIWHYRLGFTSGKVKNWAIAEKHLRIAITLNPKKSHWKYRLAFALDRLNRKVEATEIYHEVLEQEGNTAVMCQNIGKELMKLSRWAQAETAFQTAIEKNKTIAQNFNYLAQTLNKQAKWWQEIETLEAALKLSSYEPSWNYRLGEAYIKMGQFNPAIEAYQKAIKLKSNESEWHYRLGYALENAERFDEAKIAYAESIKLDSGNLSKRFGIGVFHQNLGLWQDAINAYSNQLTNSPQDAELYYRLGMAYDRCYQWSDAQKAYQNALAFNLDMPYWHYRLGFVFERQEYWLEAAEAYNVASKSNVSFMPYWRYRQGYVLAAGEQYEEACNAYLLTLEKQELNLSQLKGITDRSAKASLDILKSEFNSTKYLGQIIRTSISLLKSSLELDITGSDLHYQLGSQFELDEDWNNAASAYIAALDRKEQHTPLWYYRLGFVLTKAQRYREACDAFMETRIHRLPRGVDIKPYEEKSDLKPVMAYTEYFETLPVKQHVILYESYLGASISCNPLAIFKSLLNHPDYENYQHVWVLNDKSIIPKEYRKQKNIIFISRGTDLYRRYLASAGHLINNVTFPFWFIRRPEQKYLNTWHGTPLKGLGKDIPGEFMAHSNIARNFLHATHLLSPNEHTSNVMINRYDIEGIFSGKIAETGYPRIDLTLNATEATKAALRTNLELSNDLPVVLYAPTWRGAHGSAEVDLRQLEDDITALSSSPCQLLFRGHHFMEEALKDYNLPVTLASQNIEVSELLSIVDILITDYSSIFFDFLPTKRPILYYVHDLEDYTQARGLYFDLHDMPGTLCKSLEELTAGLSQQLESPLGNDISYQEARSKFCSFEDGTATQRAVNFFFNNDQEYVVSRYNSQRRNILSYGGPFIPNGITSSYLNLIGNLDPKETRAIVTIDPRGVKADSLRLEKFSELPDTTQVIGRVGHMVISAEEKWIIDKFTNTRGMLTSAMFEVYQKAFNREYIRTFGYSKFDAVSNFDGYSTFWASFFAYSSHSESTRKSIYLHNDMQKEADTRFPYLHAVARLYSNYNALISVSETMRNVNCGQLAQRFSIEPELFKFCNNTIDTDAIKINAQEPIDEDFVPWLDGTTTFVTLGRHSPEKDHAKLIRAFSVIYKKHSKARLLILGGGPLKNELQELINKLNLSKVVLLAGLRRNPFPLLQSCDCFVLPSNHEGQPMVLLEAMTLGCPIIATDIDGNRGVLQGGYGLLVENSEQGLVKGIQAFLDGDVDCKPFDPEEYQKDAVQMFYDVATT